MNTPLPIALLSALDATDIVFLLVGLVIAGLVGAIIGEQRGKKSLGAVAGVFLGPIGWLVMWLSYPRIDTTPRPLPKAFQTRAKVPVKPIGYSEELPD